MSKASSKKITILASNSQNYIKIKLLHDLFVEILKWTNKGWIFTFDFPYTLYIAKIWVSKLNNWFYTISLAIKK